MNIHKDHVRHRVHGKPIQYSCNTVQSSFYFHFRLYFPVTKLSGCEPLLFIFYNNYFHEALDIKGIRMVNCSFSLICISRL